MNSLATNIHNFFSLNKPALIAKADIQCIRYPNIHGGKIKTSVARQSSLHNFFFIRSTADYVKYTPATFKINLLLQHLIFFSSTVQIKGRRFVQLEKLSNWPHTFRTKKKKVIAQYHANRTWLKAAVSTQDERKKIKALSERALDLESNFNLSLWGWTDERIVSTTRELALHHRTIEVSTWSFFV
jgi:hypothetical protein